MLMLSDKKAYPVYDKDYKNCQRNFNEIENNYKNLFLVGRNGMHKYNNQDHAMMTSYLLLKILKTIKR